MSDHGEVLEKQLLDFRSEKFRLLPLHAPLFSPCMSATMGPITLLIAIIGFLIPVLATPFPPPPGPAGWTLGVHAHAHERLKLHVSLTTSRFDEFEKHALHLADPDHPVYGKHLKRDDLDQWMKAPDHVLSAVLEWIHSAHIEDVQARGSHMILNVTVEQAENLLDTQFYHYTSRDGRDIVRTAYYMIPGPLQQYIDMIQPTTRFPQLRPLRTLILPPDISYMEASQDSTPFAPDVSFDPIDCNNTITPGCIRHLYGLENITLPDGSTYGMGIAGFLKQYARHSDWFAFADTYAPWANSSNFTAIGPNVQDDQEDNSEASLDIQYALALAPHVPTVYYSTPGLGPLVPDADQPSAQDNNNEPFLDHLHYLIQLPDHELPNVISYSYGENEQSLPRDYAVHVCEMFAQLGARGVSIIFASGDDGPGSSCMANDGSEKAQFLATFPASCPWVTAVGGTQGVLPERAARFSGGGFSNLFYALDYQKATVAQYLNTHSNSFEEYFQPQGRAFPDVAAQSLAFQIITKGQGALVSGTR